MYDGVLVSTKSISKYIDPFPMMDYIMGHYLSSLLAALFMNESSRHIKIKLSNEWFLWMRLTVVDETIGEPIFEIEIGQK